MVRVKKRARQLKDTLSKGDLRELEVFTANTRSVFSKLDSLAKNYAIKKIKGTYKRSLAIKGLANNLIPSVIKAYNREHGKTFHRVSYTDKKKLSQMLMGKVDDLSNFYKKNKGALKRR